jgi:uncharacterized protein
MTQPWYKHRWPWLLMIVPASSVALGIVMIVLAIRNPAILVEDNYYQEGRGINRSLALDEAAASRHIQASLQQVSDRVQLQLSADNQPLLEDGLMLFVFHATDNHRDREFVLAPAFHPAFSGQGVYEPTTAAETQLLHDILADDSSWYFELRGSDNNWRLRQRVITPTEGFVF